MNDPYKKKNFYPPYRTPLLSLLTQMACWKLLSVTTCSAVRCCTIREMPCLRKLSPANGFG